MSRTIVDNILTMQNRVGFRTDSTVGKIHPLCLIIWSPFINFTRKGFTSVAFCFFLGFFSCCVIVTIDFILRLLIIICCGLLPFLLCCVENLTLTAKQLTASHLKLLTQFQTKSQFFYFLRLTTDLAIFFRPLSNNICWSRKLISINSILPAFVNRPLFIQTFIPRHVSSWPLSDTFWFAVIPSKNVQLFSSNFIPFFFLIAIHWHVTLNILLFDVIGR